MRNFLLLIALFISVAQITAQSTWKTDPYHSSVNFTIKHSGISLVPGEFDQFEGTLVYAKPDITDAKIDFTVETKSINTGVEMRDNHLRSADFFEVEKYPKMTFKSTKMELLKGNMYKLHGNLTIKDVTRPVVFDVTYGGSAKDQKGTDKVGFSASTSINRLDYNINYDPTGMGVAKTTDIVLYLQLVKQTGAETSK